MINKNICQLGILIACFIIAPVCRAAISQYPGQTLKIITDFQSILGSPEWTLIIRDADSQNVYPYVFDIRQKDNYWVALTASESYIVTASQLKWGTYAVIDNFCHLESGTITGQSMFIILKGYLSPDPNSFSCTITKYNNTLSSFIANTDEKK